MPKKLGRKGQVSKSERLEIAKAIKEEGRDIKEVAAEHKLAVSRCERFAYDYSSGHLMTMKDCGRKYLYKPEYVEEIKEFFTRLPFEQVMTQKLSSDGKTPIYGEDGQPVMEPMINKRGQVVLQATKLPTIEAWATSVGVTPKTLYNWAEREPEFAESLEFCKALQKDHLNQNGLFGNFNPVYAKFVAINTTDMRENINISNKDDPFDLEDELKRGIEQVRKENAKRLKDAE